MEILYKRSINRWDKDSFRPGPVGSVGAVITSVKLAKSAPDLEDRYDPTFSGKNQPWSGSNISDGMWKGWTSGGRSAIIVNRNFATEPQKTNVGWVMQNIKAPAMTTEPKMTPLGRYGWDTTVGSVLKAKVSGEMFLPLPGAYGPLSLPRGSQKPSIISTSNGTGLTLPAADVEVTDPLFGDTGKIDIAIPGCTAKDNEPDENGKPPVWAPAMNDALRDADHVIDHRTYPWRAAAVPGKDDKPSHFDEYPKIGDKVYAWNFDHQEFSYRKFSHCSMLDRPTKDVPQYNLPGSSGPVIVPKPGNQDKRRYERKQRERDRLDRKREEDRKKKQKMR